jgi:hypothetical protein
MKIFRALLILAVLLVFASVALANTSINYSLAPDVIASGGQNTSSANYSMNSTLGQPMIGSSNSTDYAACNGYWCEIAVVYKVYLPVALKKF